MADALLFALPPRRRGVWAGCSGGAGSTGAVAGSAGAVAVSEVNGPDIKAENDFGKTLVATRQSSVSASGRMLTHSFPAHSYTQLRATLV